MLNCSQVGSYVISTDVESQVSSSPINTLRYEQILVKEFECPICLNYAFPPIMMCQSSHILCNSCWRKCYNCPTCRAPKSLTRALTLENIHSHLTFPCKYEGCSYESNGTRTPIHEQSCMFYPIMCPLNKTFNCMWKGPIGNTKGHLMEKHKDSVYLEPSIRLVSRELTSCIKANYALIFCCFGRVFRFTLEFNTNISPDVEFNMTQIGCQNSSDRFRYVLKFFNTFPVHTYDNGRIAAQCIVSKEQNDLLPIEPNNLNVNSKWRLRYNHLVPFCTSEKGDLCYEVTIQRKYDKIFKNFINIGI